MSVAWAQPGVAVVLGHTERIRGSACRVNRAAVSSVRLERGLGTLGGFRFVAK